MIKGLNGALQAERVCGACGEVTLNALTPERIARFIRKHLPEHFRIDHGLYPGHELTLDDVVGSAIGCSSESVRRAISEHLEDANADEEDFYWPGQEYCRAPSPFESKDHERWYAVGPWQHVAHELVHGRRFFNDKARSFFEWLIDEALEAEDPHRPGVPALVTVLETGTDFFRSRIASGIQEARTFAENPAVALGAAPKERAANNRMSPAGVPLLYVSREVDTCIAEVRPSIGDTVVVGRFQSTAPLKFFDFTMLSGQLRHAALSFFDPSYRKRSEHRLLLEYLHEEIARPVRLNDTDYVMTQALAEFIRFDNQAFDGIAFRSVQCEGGVNYVLFDRGPPEAMVAQDWRPTFHLAMSTEAVSMHVIEGVRYRHEAALSR
ncbi:RES family NAD+ phosphorylase [Acidovorax sp. PRC11]|uniref:RES family NAD+ phosphorylase n=1 Tax=Acidovorax sp. PRC11 TaxID=2962592 RepID=UPI002882BE7E|nr:RES family NAD+ phosphorylase [Acidovorax sp. PRC11]MDT0136434.1 RES family NAD+ phosphorylase [Acidovorax sp. PRC11]